MQESLGQGYFFLQVQKLTLDKELKMKLPKRKTTANSRLPQWGLTWLNQVQCFYQHLCLVDSEVLRNPPLRQAANRWQQV